LLSDRAGLKHRLRRDAYAVLNVGDTVSLAKHHFAVVPDHYRTPGNLVFLQVFVYKTVNPICCSVGKGGVQDGHSQEYECVLLTSRRTG
jgi:hypothetical protein